ncbi:MAG: IS5 family transposase [Sulfurovum sp.]|nr:IS5 family transposase [Sulfurovum sp.]
MHTPSFFDFAMQNQGGRKSRKFLEEMKAYIPYESLEALLIEEGVYRPKEPGKPGRPPYPCSVLLGSLFLQAWYGLSDPMTEELIHDRISFRQFLDIKADDDIPDETTICNFRNAIMEKMLFDKIFAIVNKVMQEHRLILKEGSIVDATLIHSSEPKRKKDTSGKVISNKANDRDATYTSKRGHKYHGFKMHIASDKHGMIKAVSTTTAKDADIKELEHLTKEEEHYIVADSAYMSKANKRSYRDKGIINGIIQRRVRGQATLRAKQQKHNKHFASIRAIVELPFAFIKKLMGYTQTRFLGLEKNDQYHLLLAAAYNIRRAPNLKRKLEMG